MNMKKMERERIERAMLDFASRGGRVTVCPPAPADPMEEARRLERMGVGLLLRHMSKHGLSSPGLGEVV